MELRRLSHLVALDDERHFARAAQRVHLSQPAFSRSVQTIEASLGVRVFDRDGGQVRPTPAGEFLLRKARQLLFDARNLKRDIALYNDATLGDIAFGVGPFPAASLMPSVLTQLRKAHPGVNVRVETGNWQSLLAQLRAEALEFFVADVSTLALADDLDILRLGRQPGGAFVRTGHPLAGQPCTLAALWPYGVVSTRLPELALRALAQGVGLAPGPAGPGSEGASPVRQALECDDLHLLQTVTRETDAVLLASHAVVQAAVQAGTLCALQVTNFPPVAVEMGMVSLHKRTPSPMAQRAMATIAQVASEVNA